MCLEEILQKGIIMDNKDFTKNLLCLKLQLDVLFETVGKQDCLDFLDLISMFSTPEKEILFKKINNTLEKLLNETKRKKSFEDIKNEQFENDLYESLKAEFDNIAINLEDTQNESSRFKIINGGKNISKKKVIRFHKFG